MKPGMVSTGADMCLSLVKVLSELEQCISIQYAALPRAERRAVSLATAPAQLQLQGGLLAAMQQLFTQAQQQRQQLGKQSGSSSCALGHGPDCHAVSAPTNPTPATGATGAGPPCASCQLAHAKLLAACSALLHYWPESVHDKGPAVSAWVGAAAECALHMLQDVSTAVLQHQQAHADGTDVPQQQQPAPPADILQPGLAALELLAAVCYAAAYPDLGDMMRLEERQQLCERGALDLPCMLPSMLAVGAAAVLGQEMQRRLCRTAATSAGSGEGSPSAAAAGGTAVSVCEADLAAPHATAPRDQSSQHGPAAACARDSGSSKDAGEAGAGLSAIDAAWQLVCVTEQWAGGQLLPQPFTLLLEALGCNPKAFLLLACVWQHQHGCRGSKQQGQATGGSSQQLQSQHSSLQVLADLYRGYFHVFGLESKYIFSGSSGLTACDSVKKRLLCSRVRGQHQPQHTQLHLLPALLLMREAGRGRVRGMFQQAAPPDAASGARPARLGKCALSAASAAVACVSTWLCWVQFERQQHIPPAALQEVSAAAGGAATAPSQLWDLGGESSSAVVLEILQGQCLLLQEGTRELQAVISSWVAARTSSDSDSGSQHPDGEVPPVGEVSDVDTSVAFIFRDLFGLLRSLLATAAVDSGVLQQAAPHLFGLASTLEQLVRMRCACHYDRLFCDSDTYMPRLLAVLLGSQDLSTYAELTQDTTSTQKRQQLSAATDAGLRSCGLLPFLALAAPLGGLQQRQLLGLLFSCLKLFSTYPAGLYACSWSERFQDDWLTAACDTLWAACAAGRSLLVAGGPGGWDVATRSPGCSQAAGCSASGSKGQDQRQGRDSTPPGGKGQGSSCPSCGLGAEGTAALLPCVVLQGRALQLWVTLFRAYVQLPPTEEGPSYGSKSGTTSSQRQESHWQASRLVGSIKALTLLAWVFENALAPSTQLLAVVLQEAGFEGEQPFVERVQRWKLQRMPEGSLFHQQPTAWQQSVLSGHMVYGVLVFLWPGAHPAHGAWLQQQLAKRGQQLLGHCKGQGWDPSHLVAASGSAAPAALSHGHR